MTQPDIGMTNPVRMTVEEAAKLLDVSVDAVRKRIERGTLESEKVDGTRYVFLDPDVVSQDGNRTQQDTSQDATGTRHDKDMTPLLASMQDQIDTLKQELEDWKEEARRKDAILMTMAQRIPELEAPSEPQESPETASEEPANTHTPPTAETPFTEEEPRRRRSWWREFFRLE